MKQKNEYGQLIKVDTALESMRNSGHDLSTAVGEVVDNSIEAKAQTIHICTGFIKGKTKEITEMAFSDDGIGIAPDILQHVLTLGFSTRYNQRASLGRFGMGLKMAGISQAQRIDIYTRQLGGPLYHTYIDLVEIRNQQQTYIEKRQVDDYPARYKNLMCDEKGKEYPSGTLVVWSKIDRLVNQGQYSSSLDKRMGDLLNFLARAYRYFLSQGLKLYLDGKLISPYDPLFLMENPRLIEKTGQDCRAEIIDQAEITIENQKVVFTVTLLPKAFRLFRGDGGSRGQAKQFAFLNLADNAGRVSIIRNGREIYYNVIPWTMPEGRDKLDRFIGIEIKFPAQLDEYFQVRNVKRGAEPVDNLREEFKQFLRPTVIKARKKIRALWSETDKERAAQNNEHDLAEKIVTQADQTAPGGRAGMDLSDEAIQNILTAVLTDINIDPQEQPKVAEERRQRFLKTPVSLISANWPGKELFDIDHILGRSIVKLNTRHLFFQDIYCQLKQVAAGEAATWSQQDLLDLIGNAKVALELMIMAYAKAESLNPNADTDYSSLRSYWGIFLGEYINILTHSDRK